VTCEEFRDLLSPYADGELDLVRGVEIERHLQDCPACAAGLERARSLGTMLADPALYHQAPAGLRQRVRASLRGTTGPGHRLASIPWRPIAAAAAAAVLIAFGLWGAVTALTTPSRDELLAQQVVAAHVRSSLLENHRVDKPSSNQHVVKPWFIGKVDVAPDVKDLSKQGFTLEGGRLDYIDHQNTAALVYLRNEHLINVFIWRTAGPDRPPEYLERQGFHLIHWVRNERAFWVVSDLNETELREFADLLRR
jgi:anti-sigma factor RsiW